jgi:TRAP transporter TAXI family solute receptor
MRGECDVLRRSLTTVAMVLVGVAIAAFLGYTLLAPRTLRIAVGPMGNSDLRVSVAFLQALQREKASIRLKLVLTDGSAASAKVFEDGKADLAVVRSDIAMPAQSASVAILRREAVYFVTRPGAGIEKVAELRSRNIGILAPRPANEAVLGRVLATYGMSMSDIRLIRGSVQEIGQAVHDGTVDAVFAVAPIADRLTQRAFNTFPKIDGKPPGLLIVSEAEAIAEQYPVFDTFDLVRGAFSADPPLPDDEATTLAVTYRLVARRKLDEGTVSELTRLLVTLRLSIAAETPAANQIELPSVEDRAAKLPTHPGTIAYVEGETKTFFERYGDWFYLGVMGFSLLGSAAAAIYSRMNASRAPMDVGGELKEIARLIGRVRAASSVLELEALGAEASLLHQNLVEVVVLTEPDADRIAAIRFLLRELKDLMREKRAQFGLATPESDQSA